MINPENDKILQHAYDILHGQPWQSRDDLVMTLEHLVKFHKSLCGSCFNVDDVKALGKRILFFIKEKLSQDSDMEKKLLNYSGLNADERKQVVLNFYEILKEYSALDLSNLEIKFEDKDTRVTAMADSEKNIITFFNIGTNQRLNNFEKFINVGVHEFVHLLQGMGKTTLSKSVVTLAEKYYCSFAAFDKFDVRELTGQCWQNIITEKEAITIGKYMKDNFGF